MQAARMILLVAMVVVVLGIGLVQMAPPASGKYHCLSVDPMPDPCTGVSAPVICNHDCPYENLCYAQIAGYKPNQCKPAR